MARERNVSWRSFCTWASEIFGRFDVSRQDRLAYELCARGFRLTCVVRPRPPGKDVQEGEVRGVIVRCCLQCLNIRCLKELGEDEGVGCGGSLGNEVGGCSW